MRAADTAVPVLPMQDRRAGEDLVRHGVFRRYRLWEKGVYEGGC